MSVLGPLLFLTYINDFQKNIKSFVNFFADETMLFSVINPTKQATEILFSCKKKKWIMLN